MGTSVTTRERAFTPGCTHASENARHNAHALPIIQSFEPQSTPRGENHRNAITTTATLSAYRTIVETSSPTSHPACCLATQLSFQKNAKSNKMIICTTRNTPDATRATHVYAPTTPFDAKNGRTLHSAHAVNLRTQEP